MPDLEKSIVGQIAQASGGKSAPAQPRKRPFFGESNGKPQADGGNGNGPPRRGNGRASPAQIKALFAISKATGMTRDDLIGLLKAEYSVERPDDLTVKAASDLIRKVQYQKEGSESQFLSLPYSQVKSPSETITCFLTTLYRQMRGTSPEEREDGILWPLTNWPSDPTESGSWFRPLYHYAVRKDGRGTRGFLLWPFFHFDTHQPRQWKLLLPLFYSYRHESPRTLNRGFVSLPAFWYFRSVHGARVKAADASQSVAASDETNTGLFPLRHYTREIVPPRTASDFSILGWLYNHHYQRTPKEKEAGEDEYTRSRVLKANDLFRVGATLLELEEVAEEGQAMADTAVME